MEAKKRLYIVSFGNSREYRVEFDDVDNRDAFHHTNPLKGIETEIAARLEKEFPGQALGYFETPKVTEVDYADRDKYASYPELTPEAVKDIEEVLKKEIEVRAQDREDNLDAPYSNI